jgi:hypothetical protein
MAVVTVESLRSYLQDYETTNIPLGVAYLTDPDLTHCIEHAVDDFNETPPMLPLQWYTVETFPHRNLLLIGATVEALHLTSMKELRAEMNYSDGGITSSVYYKTPQFQSLKAELEREYQTKKMRIKKQMNLSNGFGGLE